MKLPNILYLHTHDCGRFISPYGYDMPTPNLMNLAREGAVFRQACCTSPTCSPSRAGLLFGQYGHVNGMMGLAWAGDGYEPRNYQHHLVPFLKKHGYQCAMAGVHHISKALKSKIGYDRVLDLTEIGTRAEGADTGVTADLSTEEAVDRFLQESHDQPFFLSAGFGAPHRYGQDRRRFNKKAVYVPPDDEASKYSRPLPIFPDNDVSRSEAANFKAGVKIMDTQFGAVLDALARSGHKENTLVIATTDHGPGFPGMKCNLTDWGIGVFLIMRGPGVPAGAVVDGMVSHIDLFPTIAAFLGVERPDWLQGVSLWPMLRGEVREVHEQIFAEQGYHGTARPLRAIRTPRYKLIRRYEPDPGEDSSDRGPMYEYWQRYGFDERSRPEWELYDLIFDPLERCNQTGNADYQQVFEQLKRNLEQFMQETDDPLASGVLPPSPKMLQGHP